MGAGMTKNLLETGHELVINDLRRDFARPVLEAGAEWADNPKAVATRSEISFTCLPGPAGD